MAITRSPVSRQELAKASAAADKRAAVLAYAASQRASSASEPAITAGTTAQYWRGDKTFVTLPVGYVAVTELTTDIDTTVTVLSQTTRGQILHTGTLTADRAITLSGSSVTAGTSVRVTRTGAGAFNLNINGLAALATSTWCDLVFASGAWVLTAKGAL